MKSTWLSMRDAAVYLDIRYRKASKRGAQAGDPNPAACRQLLQRHGVHIGRIGAQWRVHRDDLDQLLGRSADGRRLRRVS